MTSSTVPWSPGGAKVGAFLASDCSMSASVSSSRDVQALAALGLSRREAEVLAWVAQGKTNPEIGRIAGLSGRTVGKHLARVYAKLGVETRTAAARIVLSARRG